mmetsp:Transcript_31846/g.67867  ORF Transcript_31846/g.67867 Transcript_31846/m.67867 type:complete len:81 (-) Transcript_31846:2477-2719(-)
MQTEGDINCEVLVESEELEGEYSMIPSLGSSDNSFGPATGMAEREDTPIGILRRCPPRAARVTWALRKCARPRLPRLQFG